MKKLHKKVGAVALAGMIIAGGCLSSKLSVYADRVGNEEYARIISKEEKDRYAKNKYRALKDFGDGYLQHSSFFALVDNDNDVKVKELIQGINDAVRGKKMDIVSISSQYGQYGELDGVDAFVDSFIQFVPDKESKNNLLEPKAFFDNLEDFKKYIDIHADELDSGIYRLQVGGVGLILRVGNGQ